MKRATANCPKRAGVSDKANQYHAQRTRIKGLLTLTNLAEAVNDDAEAVSDSFCGRN